MLGRDKYSADLREMQLQISSIYDRIADEQIARENLANQVSNLANISRTTPSAPAANQLWNGELAHSVNSWFDAAYSTDDKAREAAHFFSHDAPAAGQALSSVDARTNAANAALKDYLAGHTNYSIAYADWDGTRGIARLTGTKTCDTPLPQNSLEAGVTAQVNFIAARRNSLIEIPANLRLFAGIWDNSDAQNDWLFGSVGLTATVSHSGGATERRYSLYVETDRGYSILSPEVIVANGFSAAQYAAGGRSVNLSWRNAAGYLRVSVIRYTPSTGLYEVLEEIPSGASTYIDNDTVLRQISGYPQATDADRKAVFYTKTGNVSRLAVDGGAWDSLHFPVYVPDNYNKARTTGRQWLRIGATAECNLLIGDCTTDGTKRVTAPVRAFENEYAAQYNGGTLQAKVYDAAGSLIAAMPVTTRIDDFTIELAAIVPAGAGRVLRVEKAGFNGILIDKIHLGFQENVTFAPNALDVRALQPVAAPATGQGGIGTGGTGGTGGVQCVAAGTPIKRGGRSKGNERTPIEFLEKGFFVSGEHLAPNTVGDIQAGFERTRLVKTKNGLVKDCTDSHRFRMSVWDATGTMLQDLRVGDEVYTEIDDKCEMSRIVFIGALSQDRKMVFTPRLTGGEYYIAGEWKPVWWQRILIALRLMRPKEGGIFAHNRKYREGELLE